MTSVHDRIEEIVRLLFNDESIQLADETVAADIPGWDSLAHVNLLFSVEQEFGVQFDDAEATQFRTVGELRGEIERKLAARS
jgi:acyl carrier protein